MLYYIVSMYNRGNMMTKWLIIGAIVVVIVCWFGFMKPAMRAAERKEKREKETIPPFLGSKDGLTIDDMVIMDIMDDDF